MVKKTIKPNLKSNKSTYEEQLMALAENLDDKIQLVAEGNLMLGERMDRGFADVDKRFDMMDLRMDSMENRMDSMESKIDLLEKDMRGSHKTAVGYLSRIENELADIKIELKRLKEKEADKETLLSFERRVIKIEQDMKQCKILCKNK